MSFSIIPNVVSGQTIRALGPGESARAAAQMMEEHDISAVLILDANEQLCGIVTERDLARRVVGADLVGSKTVLETIMTRDLVTLSPQDSPFDALELMRDRRIRHLPIVRGTEVVGIVSIRDLRHAIALLGTAGGQGGVLKRLGRALYGR